MTTSTGRQPWSLSRIGFWVVALVAVGYFPLTFTYFWHEFAPGAPMLQDELQGAVVGHDFAFGHGSVAQLRAEEYAANRVVMLVHTTTGALALDRILGEWRLSVEVAGNLLVMRTRPGSAHVVGAALDEAAVPGIAGTIAGDDTLFIAVRDGFAPAELADRLG